MVDAYYFDELATVQRSPVFTLSSIYPLDDLRNVITGTPADTSEEYVLSSGDRIESAELGRYIPGYPAQAGIGVRVVTPPTGDQVLRWGLHDDNNGFFFEQDTTGVYTVIRRGGTDTRTAQADWNVDPADGSGKAGIRYAKTSGFDLDTSAGNIYQIVYTWYGYGQIEYQILDNRRVVTNPVQRTVPVHRLAPTGQTSVANPNLPVTVENIGTGDGVIALGGRQFSIIGRYDPERRTYVRTRFAASTSTSWTPIIALRRKDNDDAARTKIRISDVSAIATAKTQLAVVSNPNVTFGTVVAADVDGAGLSATEFSVDPSAYSVGDGEMVIAPPLISTSGSGGNASGVATVSGASVPVTRRRPVVVVARTFTGTGSIDLQISVDEEW